MVDPRRLVYTNGRLSLLPATDARLTSYPRDREWIEQNQQIIESVIQRIRAEGALGSSDFPNPEGGRSASFWSWKPAKKALETLFNSGELMITERRKFQRIYDLAERVLPSDVDTTEPSEDEMARFVIRRALNGRGFASMDSIHWGRGGANGVPDAIEEMKDSGEIVELEIGGSGDETYYALTKNFEEVSRRGRKRLHILSPFDNLVIHRGRLSYLFDFGYKLECYLPAVKRQYGYFCLPMLWGKEFVGRLDAKADRKKKTFIIRKMMFEPGFKNYDGILPTLVDKLWSFATFNGCERITVEQVFPEKIGSLLNQELAAAAKEA